MTDYTKIEIIKNIIQELVQRCGIDKAGVSYEESLTKGLVFNINCGPEAYLLIGRQGATLHALEVLVGQMAERKLREPLWFTLDVDDYKMKREWFLKETAKAAFEKAKMTGRGQSLEPMPNFERRLVHAYLQEHYPEVYSESIGQDPFRKVVIRMKR